MTRTRAILDCSSLGVWVTAPSPDVAFHLWAIIGCVAHAAAAEPAIR